MGTLAKDKLIHNLKIAKIMKASGYTDKEIAKYCDLTTTQFLQIIAEDDYLKEVFEKASEKVASEIEARFLKVAIEKLEDGKTDDAKFYLERTNPRYSRKESLNVEGSLSIDEIIRNKEDEQSTN